MSKPIPTTAADEWKLGWKLVLASSVGFSFFSIMIGSTGLFMEPLGKEFGWSRTLLSSGPSIATFSTAILGPVFGMLVDRYGTRRLAIPGLVLTIASVASFALLDGSAVLWFALWGLYGVVSVSIKSTAWTTAVLSIFSKSRGLALAITLGGTALTQVLVPPLGNFLIETFGWRAAYVWLALGWGGVTLVLCLLFFFDINDDARDRKRRKQPALAEAADLSGLTIPQALRDTALWRVAISNFVVMLLTIGLMIHMFEILREAGVSRSHAALLTSLGGVAGIVGKLLTGVLLDRFRPNWIGGITLGIAAVTFAVLWKGLHSPALIAVAMVVNGYAAGTKTQITGFLTAGYSGMKNFGAIYGVMSSLMALASGVGPLFAGRVYDLYGNYDVFLIAGVVGCTLGGLLIFSLPAYPKFEESPDPIRVKGAEA